MNHPPKLFIIEVSFSNGKQRGAFMSSMKNNKFESNKKYFTICVYAIAVLAIGTIIVKAIWDWEDTRAAFSHAGSVLSPFLIGGLIAYMINPFMKQVLRLLQKLFRNRLQLVSKILAIVISYTVVLGFVSVVLLYIIPELITTIGGLVNMISPLYTDVTNFLLEFDAKYPEIDFKPINDLLSDLGPDLVATAKSLISGLIPTLYNASMSIINWVVNLLIALIVSIYMLTEKGNLKTSLRRLAYAFLKEESAAAFLKTGKECEQIFRQFIIGKFIDSLIIGILCFILMNILQLPYTLLISVIVGVTNMIPYFGPYIGAIPGVFLTLIVSPTSCLVYLIMIIALQQFDGLILGPKILGDSTGLRPLWIIFAITIGGSLAGVLGMFLGVPTVASISYVVGKWIDRRLARKNISLAGSPETKEKSPSQEGCPQEEDSELND